MFISDTLKRNACPFPLLSHMAFCVLSLPGFKLASDSQSAVLCYGPVTWRKEYKILAQRSFVCELVDSNFHNDAICTALNHL